MWLFVTPWIAARQGPLSMEFFRQKYWSGLHSLLQGSSQAWDWTLPHYRQILYHLSHQGSGKFLKRWEHQTTLLVSWESCIQVKKQQLQAEWSNELVQDWEGSVSRLCTVPCWSNLHAEHTTGNSVLDESHAGSKTVRRNTNHLKYADGTTLMAESEKEPKNLLTRVKVESEKAG